MNLWIKYGPLIYTNSTRINGLEKKDGLKNQSFTYLLNIIGYIWNILSVGLLSIVTLCLFGIIGLKIGSLYTLLYVYLYVVFWMFYEIGYIYNDVYSVKKEKKQSRRILYNCKNNFWISQIILRIIIGLVLLIPIYIFFYKIFIPFVLIIFIMLVIFSIHNIVRNYSINMYTFIILRLLKMGIFLLVLSNMPLLKNTLDSIMMPILLFQVLDLFSIWFFSYNERLGGMNVEGLYGYSYLSIFIFCVLFWFVTKNNLFVIIPFVQLFPRFLSFLYKFPGSFSLRNNR